MKAEVLQFGLHFCMLKSREDHPDLSIYFDRRQDVLIHLGPRAVR